MMYRLCFVFHLHMRYDKLTTNLKSGIEKHTLENARFNINDNQPQNQRTSDNINQPKNFSKQKQMFVLLLTNDILYINIYQLNWIYVSGFSCNSLNLCCCHKY